MEIKLDVNVAGLGDLSEAIALLACAISHYTDKYKSEPKTENLEKTVSEEVKSEQPTPETTPTVVPTTTKEYTIDELARAGAKLMDIGLMDKLAEILGLFGVSALTDLPKSEYRSFAMKIRELGADI